MEYVRQMPCNVIESRHLANNGSFKGVLMKSSVRGVIILFDGVDVDVCLIDVFGVDLPRCIREVSIVQVPRRQRIIYVDPIKRRVFF